MGVVYKINQDILAFILSEKQRHPGISCRRLSEIVHERFSVTISKSSINALLKREQLSSPVGRRALPKKKAGKFQIPVQKKTTLFPPREQFVGENKIIQTRGPAILPITSGLPRPIPRLGMIFLKAAEWALCGESLLGGVLSEGHPEQHRQVFALAADQLIYQALFKEDNPDQENFSQIEASLSAEAPVDHGVFEPLLTALWSGVDLQDFSVRWSIRMAQVLTEVYSFKVVLEDGSIIFLDADLISVWTKNPRAQKTRPVYLAVNRMTQQIINNVQSAVLGGCPISGKKGGFSKSLVDIFAAFDNKSNKKMCLISALDAQGQELASFDVLPDYRRSLIVPVWPWQREFDLLQKKARPAKVKKAFFEEIGKEVLFFEGFSTLGAEDDFEQDVGARVVFARQSGGTSLLAAVLTNAPRGDLPGEEVLARLFARCPSLAEGSEGLWTKELLMSADSSEQGASSEREPITVNPGRTGGGFRRFAPGDDMGAFIVDFLLGQATRDFFSAAWQGGNGDLFKKAFLSLPGIVRSEKQRLLVCLFYPPAYQYQPDLAFAVGQINEAGIVDSGGRRLVLQTLCRG